MAYSDFTFTKLQKDYGINQEDAKLFASIVVVAPTSRLQQDIEDAKILPLYSEKAKSEAIIFPILLILLFFRAMPLVLKNIKN
jgi:hypothetical protein